MGAWPSWLASEVLLSLAGVAAALLLPSYGFAQEEEGELRLEDLDLDLELEPAAGPPRPDPDEAVVVTGSRMEQRAADQPTRVEVIDRQEIEESGARDAAELLEERGSVQLQRSFRGTELWLRGMDPQYTLVLVDGDRVPGRTGGAIDLSRYGAENIERIELVRGPSSALYGSDAIGGIVHLITRDSQRDFEADAMASYGLNEVADLSARVAARPERHLRVRLTAGLHRAAAYRANGAEQEGAATSGSGRTQWSLGGRLEWTPSRRERLRMQLDYSQTELNGVDDGAGGVLFDRTQLQEQVRGMLEHRFDGPGGLRLITRLSYAQYREQYFLDQRGGDRLDHFEDNREHMAQITSMVRVHLRGLGDHIVTAGLEELFQVLDSERLSERGDRSRYAVFAQDEWIVWEEGEASLTLVPGLRYDIDTQFGDQLSPKLSLRFDPLPQLVVRASYGRGFRAPSFQQLLLRFENSSVGYVVEGNPDLGAESAHGVDVSVEWKPVEALTLSAAFFRNDVEGMITPVTVRNAGATGTLFSYANLATAWTMGLESSASLRIDDLLGVVAGYTFTETWDGENQRRLENRARHRVSLAARLAYEPWQLSLVARGSLMIDRVVYEDLDEDGVEEERLAAPIAQIDLRLAARATRHLELFFGVDNLLNAGDAYTPLRPFTFYGGARGRY